MADQIGIKAKLHLSRTDLDKEIAAFRKEMKDIKIKIDVDPSSLNGLKELQKTIDDIYKKTKEAIKLKVDIAGIDKYSKGSKISNLGENAFDGAISQTNLQAREEFLRRSLDKQTKMVAEYAKGTTDMLNATITYSDNVGNKVVESYKRIGDTKYLKLDTTTFTKDSAKIEKSIQGINDGFVKLQGKLTALQGWEQFKDTDDVASGIASMRAELELLNSAGTNANPQKIAEIQTQISAYNGLLEKKQEEIDIDNKIVAIQNTLSAKVVALQKQIASGYLNGIIDQEDIDRLNAAIDALSNGSIKNDNQLASSVTPLTQEVNRLGVSAKQTSHEVEKIASSSHGLKRVSETLAKFGLYFSSWQLTRGLFSEVSRGIGTITELDNAIVQVGIDMNISTAEATKLRKEAQKMATETGIAIEQIVEVAGVYSNATENMTSVLAKVKPSAILAAVANTGAKEITDMFQGVINQYQLAGEDVETISYQISDTVIAVAKNMANNFDDSIQSISDAMLKSGSVMNDMGYTYQETAAIMGTLIERTRQSGDVIGNAMKTISARIGGAKTDEAINPEEVSKAAKAYESIGISIVNTDGTFKDMKDTLAELSLQWETMTDVEKSYIAEASAGNRQRNIFMNMMDGMTKTTELFNIAVNSQGETLETNKKYLESTRAKTEQFKASLDTLWQNSISSDTVKGFIELGTTMVKVVDNVGGLTTAFTILFALMLNNGKIINTNAMAAQALGRSFDIAGTKALSFSGALKIVKSGLDMVAIKTALVQAAISFGLSIAITGAITLLTKFTDSLYTTKSEMKELNEELQSNIENIGRQVSSAEDLLDKQVSLHAKLNQTTDEAERLKIQEELQSVYRDIANILPETVTEYDANNKGLATNVGLIREQLALKKELMAVDAKLWLDNNNVTDASKYIEEANRQTEADMKKMEEIKALQKVHGASYYKSSGIIDEMTGEEIKTLVNLTEEYNNLLKKGVERNKANAEIMEKIRISGVDIETGLEFTVFSLGDATEEAKALGNALPVSGMEQMALSAEQLMDAIKASADSIDELQGVLDELDDKDSKGVSTDSINLMVEKYPELLQYIGNEKKLREEIIALQDTESVKMQQNTASKILALSNEEKAAFKTMNAKVEYDTEWYNTTIKNNTQLVSEFNRMYGIDLRNYNSLAEAKNEVDQRYIGAAIKNYNQLYAGLNKANQQAVKALTGNEAYDSLSIHDKWMLDRMNATSASTTIDALSWTPVDYAGVSRSSSSASGSGSSNKYESDLAGYSKSLEKIQEYEKTIEEIDRKIEKTTSTIDNLMKVGTDASLQQALVEQNKLIDLQKEKYNALTSSVASLKTQRDIVANQMRNSYGIDMSTMTDEDKGRVLDKLFPQIVSTNQAVVNAYNARRDTFSDMWDDYMNYADSVIDLESQIVSAEGNIIDAVQARYDTEFQILDKYLEERHKLVEDAENKLSTLGKNDFNGKENILSKQLEATEAYKNSILSTIFDLKRHLATLEIGSAEWQLVTDKVEDYYGLLQDSNEELLATADALEALRSEEFNASMGLLDDIASVIRKRYEDAKQLELDMIDKATEAEVERKRAEIDYLQERIDALRDDRMDREAEVIALKQELEMWRTDDSIYAKAKIAELEKLVAEKERDLEIDTLEKTIENIEGQVDAIEEASKDRKDIVTNTYDDLLSDENVYQQAVLAMTSSTQDEILLMLLGNEPKYRAMGTILGAAFAKGMSDEIEYGLSAYSGLLDGMNGDTATTDWYNNLINGSFGTLGISPLTLNATPLSAMTPTTDGLISGSANSLIQQLADNNLQLTLDEPLVNISAIINNFSGGDATSQLAELQRILSGALPGSGVMLNLTTN